MFKLNYNATFIITPTNYKASVFQDFINIFIYKSVYIHIVGSLYNNKLFFLANENKYVRKCTPTNRSRRSLFFSVHSN